MSTNALSASAHEKPKGILRQIGEGIVAVPLVLVALLIVAALGLSSAILAGPRSVVRAVRWMVSAARWIARKVRALHLRAGDMKRTLFALVALALSVFAFIYVTMIQFSAFPAGILAAVLGCALFYAIVKFGHSEIDLIKHLEEGNEAVPKHFFSYAFIIACALAGALLAGF